MKNIFFLLVFFCFVGLLLLYSGCTTDFGEGPAGSYLFLTYTISDQETLLVGDLRYIPAVVCETMIPSYFKFDSVKKSLDIYNHPSFDVDGIQLFLWRTNNRSPGRSYCPFARALPVRNLPVAIDSSDVREILSDGTTRLLMYGQEVLLPPNQIYRRVVSQPRLFEGYYTIPPDTTQYPFILQERDVIIVQNYGWCPRNLVSFKGW